MQLPILIAKPMPTSGTLSIKVNILPPLLDINATGFLEYFGM